MSNRQGSSRTGEERRFKFVILDSFLKGLVKMVEEADVVITMGCGADVCPVVPKRAEEWRIEDQAGKPIAKFREARNEIKERVENLVKAFED